MIAADSTTTWLIGLVAPLVWRSDEKIADKLDGFAATEAGSALDMLKAAELVDDPALRRLFFRHAMDEARHARMFRDAARAIRPGRRGGSGYELIHATRQNLFQNLGLVRFVAFVHVAERAGAAQFAALARHFQGRGELGQTFAQILKDERFHVGYSGKILARWSSEGGWLAVRSALFQIRAKRAWEAWKRSGRVMGDLLVGAVLGLLYLVVLPPFALAQRRLDPERAGWKKPPPRARGLSGAGRQF
jgi:hypothetical protein